MGHIFAHKSLHWETLESCGHLLEWPKHFFRDLQTTCGINSKSRHFSGLEQAMHHARDLSYNFWYISDYGYITDFIDTDKKYSGNGKNLKLKWYSHHHKIKSVAYSSKMAKVGKNFTSEKWENSRRQN